MVSCYLRCSPLRLRDNGLGWNKCTQNSMTPRHTEGDEMATYTADQIADTLIALARERHIDVSNLKLQKLLYYTQAWHLAFTKSPLFGEEFEAWVHGPVVPRVFRRFKDFGWKTIDVKVTPLADPKVTAHISAILEAYGHFDARQLERLSHSEGPWKAARGTLAPDESSSNVITKASMREFYWRTIHGEKA